MENCRFCGTELTQTFIDLGLSPIANNYISSDRLQDPDEFYPLHAYVCTNCFLVQVEEFEAPEKLFNDYAYFSSYSESWLAHAKTYAEMAVDRFQLKDTSLVIEIASNDGYLLQYFKQKGIKVLGIEPAANVAEAAREKGIETISQFFTEQFAKLLNLKADLIVANNVLAHVPDINGFISGIKMVLKEDGIFTAEFPNLMNILLYNQFDTIYHEHFSYISFSAVKRMLEYHGLRVFDVEEVPTHGGSVRVYARHLKNEKLPERPSVIELLNKEDHIGLNNIDSYIEFGKVVKETKGKILECLADIKARGKTIIAYGAPAKGNTLLNYCGISTDYIEYTVDLNPHKQGRFLPGIRIPIYSPDLIRVTKPDYILILPWNLKDEIIKQLQYTREWGCQFIIPIPSPQII